jgi:hypothetical protein
MVVASGFKEEGEEAKPALLYALLNLFVGGPFAGLLGFWLCAEDRHL